MYLCNFICFFIFFLKKSKKVLAIFLKCVILVKSLELRQLLKPLKNLINALLAQLAEHLTLNQGVRGSNPRRRTKKVLAYIDE